MAWNTSAQLYMREQPCFRKRLVFLKLIYFIRTNNHILTKLMLSWTNFLVLVGVSCYLLFKIFEKRLCNIFWTANATDFIHLISESSTMERKNCPSPTARINFLAVSLLDCFLKSYIISLWEVQLCKCVLPNNVHLWHNIFTPIYACAPSLL